MEEERQGERRAHREARRADYGAVKRSATASSSREEAAQRRAQRKKADIEGRGVATAIKMRPLLPPAEAVEVMKTQPTRCPPDVVLEGPHDATPMHHRDWTIVPGSYHDPEKREQELRNRERRNKLIHEHLAAGRSVFYRSSGNSMWPLVQSDDGILLHPIQAVTAKDGTTIEKEESEISVGDIVFCEVQRSKLYYAHIVLEVYEDLYRKEPQYWIGNIEGRMNGHCYREHIFGILVDVQVWWEETSQYYSRPHPKALYAQVAELVKSDRWSTAAYQLCYPSWESTAQSGQHEPSQSSGAQSSGQQG
jgi:hypothetical protein